MLCTARVEVRGTAWAFISRAQVLIHRQFATTAAAEHSLCVAFVPWPDLRRMVGQGVMAADAGVVPAAAFVLDGNYVQVRVPVGTFCGGRHVDAVDEWMLWTWIGVYT